MPQVRKAVCRWLPWKFCLCIIITALSLYIYIVQVEYHRTGYYSNAQLNIIGSYRGLYSCIFVGRLVFWKQLFVASTHIHKQTLSPVVKVTKSNIVFGYVPVQQCLKLQTFYTFLETLLCAAFKRQTADAHRNTHDLTVRFFYTQWRLMFMWLCRWLT